MAANLQRYVSFTFDKIEVLADLTNYQATFGGRGISIVEHGRSGNYNVINLNGTELYNGKDPARAARAATRELCRA